MNMYHQSPWKTVIVTFLFFQLSIVLASSVVVFIPIDLSNLVYTLFFVQLAQLVLVKLFLWKTAFSRYTQLGKDNIGKALLLGVPILFLSGINLLFAQSPYGAIDLLRLLIICLMIGFTEEAIYRGVIYGVLKNRNPLGAMVISSLLFGSAHLVNFIGFPLDLGMMIITVLYTGSIGFLFTAIYRITQSFSGIVLLHALYNYFIMISFPLEESLTPEAFSIEVLGTYAVLIGIIIAWSCGILWYDQRKKSRGITDYTGE